MGNPTFSMLLLHLLLLSLMSSNAQSPTSQPPLGSTAQPPDTKPPLGSPPPAPAPAKVYTKLPLKEVNALNQISSKLGMFEQQVYNIYSCKSDDYIGITCNCSIKNETVCHVTRFIMENKGLTGVISPAFGELAYLDKLFLYGNKLHGSIPSSLWNLTNLTKLDLSQNRLSGVIPDNMEKMKRLNSINLAKNFLNGSIPHTLGNLTGLRRLSMHSNLLTGEIPKQLGELKVLETMELYNNRLNGSLPTELGELKHLTLMQLSGNNITDKVPSNFSGLLNLEIFIVSGNGLSGLVPEFMADWEWLRHLDLMGTNLEGPLPSNLFNHTRLEKLYVSDLRISNDSTFPPIHQLPELNSLILRNCSISGKIPKEVGGMALVDLDLSFNNLSGEIPVGLQNLSYLCLSRNNFSGPFPDWVFQNASKFMLHKHTLDFSYNNFSANNSYLVHMSGKENNKYVNTFNCCTDTGVQQQKKDTRIGFTNHMLQTIKKEHCLAEKSQYYSLHINCGGEVTNFHGTKYEADNSKGSFSVSQDKMWASSTSGNFIASSVGSGNYTWNKTCGSFVPDDILSTARISPLTLDYYGLCFRNDMYNVRLHFAETVYTEVEDYSNLGIRLFDIYIQGERVKKDFNIKAEAKASGNPRVTKNFSATVTDNILHIHFRWAGKGSIYAAPGLYGPLISAISITSDYKPGRRTPVLTTTSIAVASVGFLLAFFSFIALKMDHEDLSEYELEGEKLEIRHITYRDIVKATDNFKGEHKISKGGVGTVYKAVVPGKGTLAVKKLSNSSMMKLDEFLNEAKKIESLKDNSLVQLLGWFTGGHQHWLIYEYMENNSLHHALFEKKVELSWGDRYKICCQIAMGLVYLHETAEPKVIHRDITPSNILLDKNFNAKITGFGLARFYNEEQHSQFTKTSGTHGYMASEYFRRGLLTVKTDVYSYGVVILEIVSGKSNTNYNPNQESQYLVDQACVKQKAGELMDLVDKHVTFTEDYKQDEAAKVLNLVILCTNQTPTLRPTMLEVLSILDGEKTIDEISGTKKSTQSSGPEHSSKFHETLRGLRKCASF